MPADSILVIDAGTSALRGAIVDAAGIVTAIASEPWSIVVPEDVAPFGREFNAAGLEESFARVLEAAASHRPRIAGIALTGQREGLVFAGSDGHALLASPNVDARAAAEGIAIDAAHATEVYITTGHLPSLMHATAKWHWLVKVRPDDAALVRTILPLSDWLAMRLTGRPAISRSLAVENGLCDVTTGEVAASLLDSLGFPRDRLAHIVSEGDIVGDAAAGPLAGVPVILAGADTQCTLLGLGATQPGDCGVAAGWSAPVQLVTDAPRLDPGQRTWSGLHVVGDRWMLESNAGEMGRSWDWLCSMLAVSPSEGDALAAKSPRGARDALTVLGPRVMHAARMNAGVGAIAFPLPIVMSAPDRCDLLRSALESIAFAIRANVEQLERVAGARVGMLRLGGGMSRSRLVGRILADVLDRPIGVSGSPETSAIGAAVLSAVGVGLHASLNDAVGTMTGARPAIQPDAGASAEYDDYYERWSALCERLEMGGL